MQQAARELQLGRSITPTSLSSQFCQTAFGSQLGRGILPREIGTQVRDREQQLQLQRALHLLRESTSSHLADTSFGQIDHLPWLPVCLSDQISYEPHSLSRLMLSQSTKNGWSSDFEHGHCYQQCTICVTAADSSLRREGMWICCNDVLT